MKSKLNKELLSVSVDQLRERPSLIEHRMEYIESFNGVEAINDSKATDLRSVNESLMQIEKPVVLILQTTDFPEDYSILVSLVKYKVVSLVVFGVEQDLEIRRSLSEVVDNYDYVSNLTEAVSKAKSWSKSGDVVLFSPGCASFGMFEDYRHRGDSFKSNWNN